MIPIRRYTEKDGDELWRILEPVIERGDSFAYESDASKTEVLAEWCAPGKEVFVAEAEGRIAGSYHLKPNQPGRGSHIANASYVVSPEIRRRGIGRALGEHSLRTAREMGFRAMQFNLVVKSNERAVRLWQSLGFGIIGEIPEAFRHREQGLTNAYIMYRKL